MEREVEDYKLIYEEIALDTVKVQSDVCEMHAFQTLERSFPPPLSLLCPLPFLPSTPTSTRYREGADGRRGRQRRERRKKGKRDGEGNREDRRRRGEKKEEKGGSY